MKDNPVKSQMRLDIISKFYLLDNSSAIGFEVNGGFPALGIYIPIQVSEVP